MSQDEPPAWLGTLQVMPEMGGYSEQYQPAVSSEQSSVQAPSGLPGIEVARGLQRVLTPQGTACAGGRTVG